MRNQQSILTTSTKRTYLVLNALDVGESSLVDPLLLQISVLHKERVAQQFTTFLEQLGP